MTEIIKSILYNQNTQSILININNQSKKISVIQLHDLLNNQNNKNNKNNKNLKILKLESQENNNIKIYFNNGFSSENISLEQLI